MKNVHLIPTDKPSRLRIGDNDNFVLGLIQNSIVSKNDSYTNQHIYITSDEEIKEGDYIFETDSGYVNIAGENYYKNSTDFKIILTTDPDLIGVQSIDDEFLEWFVKNPSCEFVEVVDMSMQYHDEDYYEYKIIIPQEEPKQECSQLGTKELNDLASAFFAGKLNHLASAYFGGEPKRETLEEAAERYAELSYYNRDDVNAFVNGAKWQAKRMYSEEEAKTIWKAGQEYWKTSGASITFEELTEQFKKK